LLVALLSSLIPVQAADEDWDISGGHFFTQTGGGDSKGYSITDGEGVKFWSEFQRLGGVPAVGYPVTERFEWAGFTVQAFQRVVFQWRPEAQQAFFVNMFDMLSENGKDDWLFAVRQTPKPGVWSESGLTWDQIVKTRLAVMDGFPEIARVYNSVPGDPIAMNGLPVAEIADMGSAFVLRAQRVVIQQWKEDVPWAKKGQVTVANGGDIGKEAGLYPQQATVANGPQSSGGTGTIPLPTAIPVPVRPTVAPAVTSGGKITFTSNRDSWDDVFVMNTDGTNQKRLTVEGRSYAGTLSPDGTKIVYDSASSWDKKSNYQIYVMNVDGTGVQRLTTRQSEDWYPAWSADGTKIAFYRYVGTSWGIWIMNADGTDQRLFVEAPTSNPQSPVAWAPDGTLAWGRTEDLTIWAVNPDGGGRRRIVGQFSAYPSWSSSGRLAFSKYERAGGVFQIWTANADGSQDAMLTSRGQNFWPTWSPDGTKIAFSSYRDGNWEVYSMNADGSNQVNLTNSPRDDKAPHWSR
jgi:Tol biopolymer transport system component